MAWGMLLLLGVTAEMYIPDSRHLRRLVEEALLLLALAALLLAALDAFGALQDPRTFTRQLPGAPIDSAPMRRTARTFAPPPRAGMSLTGKPRARPALRFGSGAEAQRRPWLLPRTPAPMPGLAADEAVLGDVTLRAASLVGPAHRCEEPAGVREDAYRLGRDLEGRHLVVAVADGVSSAARADLGALIAASTAVNALLERLNRGVLPDELNSAEIFDLVASRMHREAETRGLDPQDIAATLMVAVTPTRHGPDGTRPLWAGWIGDSTLWILHKQRWTYVAGNEKPQEGGISSNELAHTLPGSPEAARHWVWNLADGSAVTLVSDGVGDGLEHIEELNSYLARHWATPPPLSDFMAHVGYDARQFLDDRTAVSMWLGQAGEAVFSTGSSAPGVGGQEGTE